MSTRDRPIERTFDVLLDQASRRPRATLLASRPGEHWVELSCEEVRDRVDDVSSGLLEMGIEPGDRVGLLATNRPEWNFVDLGTQQIGALTVGLFPKMSADNLGHILRQSRPAALFVEGEELRDRVRSCAEGVVDEERILPIEDGDHGASWMEAHGGAGRDDRERIEEIRAGIDPDDLATIVYTSGTTGKPKGVQLSHHNLISNLKGCADLVPVREGARALSFLPLVHAFERMLNYVYMARGLQIFYAREIDTIGEDMRDVKPEVFTTVPRLLQKVWERIEGRREELEGLRAWLFDRAVAVADDYELQGRGPLYEAKLWLARRLVLSRWREGLGGEVVAVISGGAALSPHLNRRFTAAGIDILEGYGLTETAPVLTVNRYDKSQRRFGSVGKPIDDVRLRIAEDGEILARGPNVTRGYYRDQEATQELFDEDGWLHTGDMGRIDEDGFLYVEDRKKSVFKTSGGEYVAPAPVESALSDRGLVEHAMLVGEGRKMVTALIQPAWDNLESWCDRHGVEADSREALVQRDEVRDRYEAIVEEVNRDFDETARVKRFTLVPDSWSAESGELTPTMKVRRDDLLEQYADRVDAMYED